MDVCRLIRGRLGPEDLAPEEDGQECALFLVQSVRLIEYDVLIEITRSFKGAAMLDLISNISARSWDWGEGSIVQSNTENFSSCGLYYLS